MRFWPIALASSSLLACSSNDTTAAASSDAASDVPSSGDDAANDDVAADDATGNDAPAPGDAGHDAAKPKPPCSSNPDAIGVTQRTAKGGNYVGYAPASYDKTKLYTLVVALHGAGDTAANYLSVIWQANADAKGFLVIAPEGSYPLGGGYTWNSGDYVTIVAAADDFYACYSIDPKKTIIHGFSAGGIMSYMIGLADAKRWSAISIASADLQSAEAVNGAPLLPATWKIPVSHFHGTQDQNFPIQYAIDGMNRLVDAGHPFYWHPFNGGHTTNPSDALQMYEDLQSSTAP